jgi:hypothetical protein
VGTKDAHSSSLIKANTFEWNIVILRSFVFGRALSCTLLVVVTDIPFSQYISDNQPALGYMEPQEAGNSKIII